MPTLTLRNVPPEVVESLKALARRNHHSMEQELRAMLEEYVGERQALFEQIEASWERPARRPTGGEGEAWIDALRT